MLLDVKYKLRLSWAKLSTIGDLDLLKLKLELSLAIKFPHIVDMRSTHLANQLCFAMFGLIWPF